MVNTLAENFNTAEKFQSAEQLWFWFLYSKSIQQGLRHNYSGTKRPCELLDVEVLITKLYLSGQLKEEHLEIMKKYGDKRRAPHQYVYAENKASALWASAMNIIETHARKKGWIAE